MSPRISWLLCFTSTQKHSTWNTNWIWNEQYWCGGHSGRFYDQSLREELQSCRHFLVDSEIQKGRYSVFNFAVNNLTAQFIEENLYRVLDKLKCVAKLGLALGFFLKNIEDGKFRYFYAHENNTLLEQSKLVKNKDDIAKLKEILKKTDVIESCTKERSDTNWRFFK